MQHNMRSPPPKGREMPSAVTASPYDVDRSHPRSEPVRTNPQSDRWIVIALAVSGLVAAFMQTVVTPIIPELPALLHTSSSNSSWVLTATLLAAAVTTPITGRLGDMYGKRKIVLLLLTLT